ncbi:MAG TPA: M56 family metallopeptidase [Candidatus Eisenbacteria bacterium]|jgi:beta-lactamase regulating signal transducer with metallopeptidase domain|nr:M56 family metallopeptidase [Candidatus Eisenbacteria bacterium]
MPTLTAQLAPRQSAALWLSTMAAVGIAAAAIATLSSSAASLAVWCRDFVAASSAGRGAAAVALAIILGAMALAAAGNLAAFFVAEALASLKLSRSLAAKAVAVPGRVRAALGGQDIRCSVAEDQVPFAVTVGLFSPRIVVSTGLVSSLTLAELRAVLAHEAHHCLRRDPLRAVAWESLRRAFFFLPVIRDVARHFSLAREIDADRHALTLSGSRALAAAMYKAVSAAPLRLPSGTAAFGQLQPRINALKGAKGAEIKVSSARFAVSLAAATLIAALNAGIASTAALAAEPGGDQCRAAEEQQISSMDLSPYFSILVLRTPQMSKEGTVQSVEVRP